MAASNLGTTHSFDCESFSATMPLWTNSGTGFLEVATPEPFSSSQEFLSIVPGSDLTTQVEISALEVTQAADTGIVFCYPRLTQLLSVSPWKAREDRFQ